MKISISFPPLESEKGVPLLTQNRQFQWFSRPTFIYPVVLASAATVIQRDGHEVFWDDGIAERMSYGEWLERLEKEKPDIIVIETKTPVIKRHWEIIKELKAESGKWKVVLLGDHVSALPEESLKNSPVDFVVQGGDYDLILAGLIRFLNGQEELKGGIWYRDEKGKSVFSGEFQAGKNILDSLPLIDRELTRWKLYSQENGNFKKTPGAYVMNARDCWWGRCAFCSWAALYPEKNYRCRSAARALDEIGELIRIGVREVMEDSGTLPTGQWLEDFCQGMIERGYSDKITIDCNMRLNAIRDQEVWMLMKKAGFRMILFGFESANQKTLDRINKGLAVEEVASALRACKKAGLEPHLTVMAGYPWETEKEMENTLRFVKKLFRENLVDSLQATIVTPYPGTPFYEDCQKNDLLRTDDYDRFDQRQSVLKLGVSDEYLKRQVRRLYRAFLTPAFLKGKIGSVRNLNDLAFLLRSGVRFLGHSKDFSGK